MHVLFYLGFVAVGIIALALFGSAESAIHQGVAAILFVGSLLLLVGGAACSYLVKIRKAVERADENAWKINHAIWRELREPGNKDPEPVGTAAEK